MLFLPGAFVNQTCYAKIAKQLAETGNIFVVVLSMEPCRLALPGLGADYNDLYSAMERVEKEWECSSSSSSSSSTYGISSSSSSSSSGSSSTCSSSSSSSTCSSHTQKKLEWSIAGHSLGGYSAMRLSTKVKNLLVAKTKRTNYRHQTKLSVVLWATGSNPTYVTDLSQEKDAGLDVLVIGASKDPMCNLCDENTLQFLQSKLPPPLSCGGRHRDNNDDNDYDNHNNIRIIQGGTHNYFASYDGPVEFNGIPDITREEQHDKVVDFTLKFLKIIVNE